VEGKIPLVAKLLYSGRCRCLQYVLMTFPQKLAIKPLAKVGKSWYSERVAITQSEGEAEWRGGFEKLIESFGN
jgi:hypothetical protein